nr:MAG TPA: hypothetical protein [Caudoviricetes sp.]
MTRFVLNYSPVPTVSSFSRVLSHFSRGIYCFDFHLPYLTYGKVRNRASQC